MPRKRKSTARRASARKVSFKKSVRRSDRSKASNVTGQGNYKYTKNVGPFERLGTYLGNKAGQMVGNVTGMGDYALHGTEVLSANPPRMFTDKEGTYIEHREYLGDLISSSSASTFKVQRFGICPSDSNSFPWLSGIAQPNYQQYKFEQLIFEYKSYSGDAITGTNTALGAVFACINYDYSDPAVSSRSEVENTDWSNSCVPSQSMLIPVECKPQLTGLNGGLLYVVNGNNVPVGNDPKTYYLGNLFIGTTGCQGTSVLLGSIFVNYRIRLYKPLMTRPLSNALIYTSSRTDADGNFLWGEAEATSVYNADSIGVSIGGTNGAVLTLDQSRLQVGQRYVLVHTITGSSTASVIYGTVTMSSGISGYTYFTKAAPYDANSYGSPLAAATSTSLSMVIVFVVSNNTTNQTITLSGSPVYPTNNLGTIMIAQICGVPIENIGDYDPSV